jgi:deoxyhypusine synthase
MFLGYISNPISSGVRSVLRYLVEHKHVSVIVTSTGGIQEDLVKCIVNWYMGEFNTSDAPLRSHELNRICNLLVPRKNYCSFEDWVLHILDKILEEEEVEKDTEEKINWTPSKIIHRLGKRSSTSTRPAIRYVRTKSQYFVGHLMDGILGNIIYFHTFKSSPLRLKVDIVQDIRRINTLAIFSKRVGMIILGGGVIKHHIANAWLMRMDLRAHCTLTLIKNLMVVMQVRARTKRELGQD